MIPTLGVSGVCDLDAVTRFTKMFLQSQLELVGYMCGGDVPDAKWTIQGFGMMRCYIGDQATRLNVWHSAFKTKDVSTIHTHPWHFNSLVVKGGLVNERFIPYTSDEAAINNRELENLPSFYGTSMKPGMGGGLTKSPQLFRLRSRGLETLNAGEVYSQQAHEVHESRPADGTVTLNHRYRLQNDEAWVFWPEEDGPGGWVSAEPRLATRSEIEFILRSALEGWP